MLKSFQWNQIKTYLFGLFLLVIALVFQWLPVKNILFDYYRNNLFLPQTALGGLAAAGAFLVLLAGNFLIRNRSQMVIVLVGIAVIYLRLNGVLESAILALIYLEIIIAFGRWLLKVAKVEESGDWTDYINGFLVGLAAWSFLALVSSGLGLGRFIHLRILTLAIGIISCTLGFQMPLIIKLIQQAKGLTRKEMAGVLFLLMILLIQFVKAGYAFDSDSLWYGLRPEYVLVGPHSFFDSMNLVQFVYYYPKLYELFLIPLSNLGDYSFICSVTVTLLMLLVLVIYRLGRSVDLTRFQAVFLTALIASTPAVANMGSSAKADMFTTLLLITGFFYFWSGVQRREGRWFILAAVAILLSLGGKLSSFAYGPLLTAGFVGVVLLGDRHKVPIKWPRKRWPYMALMAVAVLVMAGICYRTYRLTGYPVYNARLEGLWQGMGLTIRYPLSLEITKSFIHLGTFHDVLMRWFGMLFDPRPYTRILILWTGNVGVYLLFVGMTLAVFKKVKIREHLLFMLALAPIIASAIILSSIIPNGGDGNYYLVPLILAVTFLFNLVIRQSRRLKLPIGLCLLLFILGQSAIMFVAHPSGYCGTSPIGFDIRRPVYKSRAQSAVMFSENGLGHIAAYIQPHTTRAVGLNASYVLHRLPCWYEDLTFVTNNHLGSAKLNSERALLDYLKWAKVDYYIMPNDLQADRPKAYRIYLNVFDTLKKSPDTFLVQDENYTLLDISRTSYRDRRLLTELNEARKDQN